MKTTIERSETAEARATSVPRAGGSAGHGSHNAVEHMTRSVLTLGSSVGMQSALGFVFVITAARMFGASASGAELTIIAVARALAAVVQLNMTVVVHRLLPTADRPARFVMRMYLITTSLAIVAGLLVVLVGGQYSDVVHDVVKQPLYAGFFVIAVASWNVFALQDIVLATLRRGRIVLIESAVYGLAAIGALFAMRAAGVERPILLAFFFPVLPIACGVSWYIFRHVIPADLALGVTRRKIDVRRESPLIIGDFLMSTLELLIRALTPVLVADWLGTDIAAGYAVAGAIAFAMGDLFTAIQRSLATELSRHPEQRRSLVRRALKLIATGVVPSALAVAVAAPVVLRIFGKDFVEASSFLRLLLLSAIPASLANVALTVARSERSTKTTVGALMILHTLTIAVILLFLRDHGLVIIGAAYAIGWTAALVPGWFYMARHRSRRSRVDEGALSDIALSAVALDEFALDEDEAANAEVAFGDDDAAVEEALGFDDAAFEDEDVLDEDEAAFDDAADEYYLDADVPYGDDDAAFEDALAFDDDAAFEDALTDDDAAAFEHEDALAARVITVGGFGEFDNTVAFEDEVAFDDDVEVAVGAEPRRRPRLSAAVWLAGFAGVAAAPFLPVTGVRTAVVLATMLILPGLPLARWLRIGSGISPIVGVALSLAIWTLTSVLGAQFDLWNPIALYEVVVGVSALVFFLGRRGSATRPRSKLSLPKIDFHSGLIVVTAVAIVIVATRGVVQHTNPEAYDSFGLFRAAPRGYLVALALVMAASVYNLWREKFSQLCAAALVGSMVFLLHGVLPLLYGTPRFGWSPKYIGVIEYVMDNHSFNRDIDAFHNWPGFFTTAATFSELVDVRPLSYAAWAPLFFNLLAIGALDFLYRSFSSDARQRWLAILLFVVANWLGQDYLAPQAFVLVLSFVMLGLVARLLSAFPTKVTLRARMTGVVIRRVSRAQYIRPDLPFFERSTVTRTAKTRGVVVCTVLFGAIAVSHQLTPVAVLLVTFVYAVFRRLVRPDLLLIMVVLFVGWMLTAHAYFSKNTYLLQLPNPFNNAKTTPFSQLRETPASGIVWAYRVGLASAATIAGIALIGLLRRIRAGFADFEVLLICGAPVLVGVGVRYGAEAPLRAYLYALPGLCFLASAAFLPRRSAWRALRAGVVCLVVTMALAVGFVLAAYGRESFNYIRADELAVGRVLGEEAPTGSFVITVAPGQDAKITRGYYRVVNGMDRIDSIFDVPGLQLDDTNIDEQRVAALVSALSDRMGNRSLFIVTGQSQREYLHEYGVLTVQSYDRLVDLLRANSNVAIGAERGGAVAFRIIKVGSDPAAG
jgi:O-antigen/teichoic acid export membrane protein